MMSKPTTGLYWVMVLLVLLILPYAILWGSHPYLTIAFEAICIFILVTHYYINRRFDDPEGK